MRKGCDCRKSSAAANRTRDISGPLLPDRPQAARPLLPPRQPTSANRPSGCHRRQAAHAGAGQPNAVQELV